ncbi:MAG: hypothetical protein NT080_12475 [Spirochaetes bacterium]|nr:hypothetical protein [Spirochaetota bacterium]
MDKSVFEKFEAEGFIKETDVPNPELNPEQKSRLNRRGNELFNTGQVDVARRIFQTTGYSDGLIRIGDRYMAENRHVDALKMYTLAHETQKSEALAMKIASVIQNLIVEKEPQ